MRRFFGVDLRDLWRRDEHGHQKLTLRQLWVYIRHGLPRESALAIDDNGGTMPWSVTEHLLADQWELDANRGRKKGATWRKHPGRAEQQHKHLAKVTAEKRAAFEKAKARRERELRDMG